MRTVPVFYDPAYAASPYAFATTRKAKWIVESLSVRPIAGIELSRPRSLVAAEIAEIHDSDYVRAVHTGSPRHLAESQGFNWNPELWPMVLSSNGGAVDAALAALDKGRSGSLSSGLHHAGRECGAGFCTFNGLVIAAKKALAHGAESVLILDLDAHCGGGTNRLIAGQPKISHLDIAVDSFDFYQPDSRNTLDLIEDAQHYLPTIRRRLGELEQKTALFDLCLYNAGMDPFEGCATGGLMGISRQILAEREQLVFEWCARRGIAIAFVLAGGYDGPSLSEADLVDLHRLTLSAAASAG